MNQVGPFGRFFGLILLIFAINWFGFVVMPWTHVGHLPPLQDADSTDITPFDVSGAAHQGEQVYAANGCVYCHTQQVRDPNSGADIIRGWGTAKDADGKDVTRRTYPRDYIWQGQTFLGTSRDGADLSNVGARLKTDADVYAWLYHPEIMDSHSSMPAYRFLFTTQKISGQPSDDALVLPADLAPPPGFEIVPTAAAKSLAAYLRSLDKGYHLKQDEAGDPFYRPPPATENKS
jgi:cytochrome c oxidase cbb3-type subunit 2